MINTPASRFVLRFAVKGFNLDSNVFLILSHLFSTRRINKKQALLNTVHFSRRFTVFHVITELREDTHVKFVIAVNAK